LQRMGEYLQIKPHIPKEWNEYQVNYRFGKTLYHIHVQNQQVAEANRSQGKVTMDGKTLTDGNIPLSDDGQSHEVLVILSS